MTGRPMYTCESCTAEYPSYLAALDCAEQDRAESYDRSHGRLFGINRGLE
jgi:hypothetical protein